MPVFVSFVQKGDKGKIAKIFSNFDILLFWESLKRVKKNLELRLNIGTLIGPSDALVDVCIAWWLKIFRKEEILYVIILFSK